MCNLSQSANFHRVHNRQEGSGLAQFGNIFLPFARIIHSCFLAVIVLMLYFMTCTGRPGMCNMSCFGLLCSLFISCPCINKCCFHFYQQIFPVVGPGTKRAVKLLLIKFVCKKPLFMFNLKHVKIYQSELFY